MQLNLYLWLKPLKNIFKNVQILFILWLSIVHLNKIKHIKEKKFVINEINTDITRD